MAVEQVAILGAGTMGAGIAQVAVTHGCTVRLIDTQPGAVERARESVAARLQRQVDRGAMSEEEHAAVMGRLIEGSLDDLEGVELVVEAVVEDLGVKQELFRQLDAAAPADAVLATNTSSLSVGEIASPLRDRSRVVGMHFFNPAPVMALVEVVAPEGTSEAAAELVAETASAWGKVPARTADAPGFIVNRVARSSYVEAFRMLDEGVAGPDVIDGAMRKLGQFRMGPMQVADLVGQEVNHAVTISVWERTGRPARFEPPRVQAGLAERGDLGRKTGSGVYDYGSDPPAANVAVEASPLALSPDLAAAVDAFVEAAALCDPEQLAEASAEERFAFARMLGTVMNEAARALGDGAASGEDIDAAMQHATNYPRGPGDVGTRGRLRDAGAAALRPRGGPWRRQLRGRAADRRGGRPGRRVSDGPARCEWAAGGDALMHEYHDREWGVPIHDDRTHFELLIPRGRAGGAELAHSARAAQGLPCRLRRF